MCEPSLHRECGPAWPRHGAHLVEGVLRPDCERDRFDTGTLSPHPASADAQPSGRRAQLAPWRGRGGTQRTRAHVAHRRRGPWCGGSGRHRELLGEVLIPARSATVSSLWRRAGRGQRRDAQRRGARAERVHRLGQRLRRDVIVQAVPDLRRLARPALLAGATALPRALPPGSAVPARSAPAAAAAAELHAPLRRGAHGPRLRPQEKPATPSLAYEATARAAIGPSAPPETALWRVTASEAKQFRLHFSDSGRRPENEKSDHWQTLRVRALAIVAALPPAPPRLGATHG